MDAFGALIEEGKLHEARPLLQAALLLMPQNASAFTNNTFSSGLSSISQTVVEQHNGTKRFQLL